MSSVFFNTWYHAVDTIDSTQYQYDNNGNIYTFYAEYHMDKIGSTKVVSFVLFLCLLFTTLFVYTCKEEYKLVEIREGFIHFSFEYPMRYQSDPLIRIGYYGGVNTMWVVARLSPEKAIEDRTGNIVLQIIAHNDVKPGYNAEYWYEDHLELYSANDSSYHIIERSVIEEGIISGRSLTYSWLDLPTGGIPMTMITREIFFDKNGITFTVRSIAEESAVRQAKADLNHLLRTFKILE